MGNFLISTTRSTRSTAAATATSSATACDLNHFYSNPFPHSTFKFHCQSRQYQSETALALAKIAELTYCSPRVIQSIALKSWGFTTLEVFPMGCTEAILLAHDQAIIVAFRGSDDPQDWIKNLNLDLVQGPLRGKTHEGFLQILGQTWEDIRLSICCLKAQARWRGHHPAVWFTGHSLGGALATLTAAHFYEQDEQLNGLYTFGSPRVGDRQFARCFNTHFGFRTLRIINKNDPIPSLPPRWLSYAHVGQLYYFNGKGQLQLRSSAGSRLLDGFKVTLSDLFDWDLSAVENHNINTYVRAVHQRAQAEQIIRLRQEHQPL